jgi:hypothetical protein
MSDLLTLKVADLNYSHDSARRLIMGRYFLSTFAARPLGRQAFNALVEHSACGFQAVYLLLLPADYFVQILQQIFLISGFYFQLDYPIIVHKAA